MTVFKTYKELDNIVSAYTPDIINETPFFKYGYYLLLAVCFFILIAYILIRPFVGKTEGEVKMAVNSWFGSVFTPVQSALNSKLNDVYVDSNGAVRAYISDERRKILEEISI